MPEYTSGRKRKQSLGISSFSENKTTLDVIGDVLITSGRIGIGTSLPQRDIDVNEIRLSGTIYDTTNYGGDLGYYLTKDVNGIKWVAVSPIDSNSIFIAENNNILGVSSFIGINIISDALLGIKTNSINPNFADITIDSRWSKSENNGIYTTNNVGIGTTIPLADFQVGFGTTGVTIDGNSGIVNAIGYSGDYFLTKNLLASGISTLNNIIVNDSLIVTGVGSTSISVNLATAGGITTTGGDLYVGGLLYSDEIKNIELTSENIYVNQNSNLNIVNINSGVSTDFNVTGILTFNNVSGIAATINNIDNDFLKTYNIVGTSASFTNLSVSGITSLGSSSPSGITTIRGDLFIEKKLYTKGTQYFEALDIEKINITGIATVSNLNLGYVTGLAATITKLDSDDVTIGFSSINNVMVTGISTFSSGPVIIGSISSTGTATQTLQVTGGSYFSSSIGIGTTIPTQLLDIRGGVRINGQIYDRFNSPGEQGAVLTADPLNSTWYWAVPPGFQIGILSALDDTVYYPTLRTVGLSGQTNGIGSASYLQVDNALNTGFSYKINPSRLGIGTTNPISALDLRGSAIISGKLGIGTTLPTANVEIAGTANITGKLLLSTRVNAFSTERIELQSYGNDEGTFSVNNYGENQLFTVSSAQSGDLFSVYRYYNYTNLPVPVFHNRKIFSIDNNGSVYALNNISGFGTFRLGNASAGSTSFNEIHGSLVIRPGLSTSLAQSIYIIPKYSDRGAISFESPIGTAQTNRGTQLFSISNNLTSTIFRINDVNRSAVLEATSSGRIGIGTTLPSNKFEVIGNVSMGVGVGSIGIGTTAPKRKLEVADTFRLTSLGSTMAQEIDIRHVKGSGDISISTTLMPRRGGIIYEGVLDSVLDGGQLLSIVNDNNSLFTVNDFSPLTSDRYAITGTRNVDPILDIKLDRSIGVGTTSIITSLNIVNTNTQYNSDGKTNISFANSSSDISLNKIYLNLINPGIQTNAPQRKGIYYGGDYEANNNGGQLVTIVNDNNSIFTVNRFSGVTTALPTGTQNIETLIDFKEDGNVGFGTSNPSAKFEFIGPIRISSVGSTSFQNIDLRHLKPTGIITNIPSRGAIVYDSIIDPTTNNGGQLLTIVNDNSSIITVNRLAGISSTRFSPSGTQLVNPVLDIKHNGNIGIDTTDPLQRFQLGAVNSSGNSIDGNVFVISETGSVGVGTTRPTTKVDIRGGINISGIATVGLGSTSNPISNSTMSFELTNNNTLTVRVRGTDGVIRTGLITLT